MVQIDWPQARQDSSSNIQEMTWLQWITEVYVVPKLVLKQELKMLANKLYILYTHLLLRLRNMCLSLRQQKRACLLLRSKIGCCGYDSERKVLQYEDKVPQAEEMPVDLLNWEDMVSAPGMGRPTLHTLIERDELRATVWGDMFRYTVFREQVHDEYDSKVFEVQLMVVGMKLSCLVRWLTIMRMESWPDEVGRVSIKSIEMEFHRCSGIGSCFSKP